MYIKNFLNVFLLIFLSLGFSQDARVAQLNIDNLTVQLNYNLTASFHGEIINTGSNDLEMVLIKNVYGLPIDCQASICIDYSCYSSSIDSVFFILSGFDTLDLVIDLIASNNFSGYLELEMFDILNPSEKILKTLSVINYLSTISYGRELKKKISLTNIYPNPFNSKINLTLDITYHDNISVDIYDINGSIIKSMKNIKVGPGFSTIKWDGKSNKGQIVKTGIYFVKLEGSTFNDILEITFLK